MVSYFHSNLQALGRPEDMLHDTAYLQFKPIFARLLKDNALSMQIWLDKPFHKVSWLFVAVLDSSYGSNIQPFWSDIKSFKML